MNVYGLNTQRFLSMNSIIFPKLKGQELLMISNLTEKMAPFLSALGPMGDLLGAFFPSTEETLLNEIIDTLKNEFKVVNERFDKVT